MWIPYHRAHEGGVSNDEQLQSGSVLVGRYRLIERIGAGAVGLVWRGVDLRMRNEVAIKVVRPELVANAELAARVEREARLASRLSHDNIVKVSDCGSTPSGAMYIVMEYLQGKTLAEVLQRRGRLPVKRALRIGRQILSALAQAHERGVVHRDLKPENIILIARDDEADIVKLLDFGIAKPTGDGAGPSLTQAGVIFGTPDYMSPEQVSGSAVDARTDLYACAAILHQMLTGHTIFEADDPLDVLKMQLSETPRSPRRVAPDAEIPEHVDRAILRALEKDRDVRFPTARAFQMALAGGAFPAPSFVSLSRPAIAAHVPLLRSAWYWLRHHLTPQLLRVQVQCAWYRLPYPVRRWSPAGAAALAVLSLLAVLTLNRSAPPPPVETVTNPPTTTSPPEIAKPKPKAHKRRNWAR
jgi:serine/threonine-protein kinase